MRRLPFNSPVNDAPVYDAGIITSTMDAAAALADQGAAFGTVIRADFQTQGRGRRASGAWESPAAENLLFTVLLEKVASPSALLKTPLLIGLAVARALESLYALTVAIKWPNDILAGDGRKVCGILCQTHGRYLLAGIGINCNQRIFPPELKDKAVSLSLLLDGKVDRDRLLRAVLNRYAAIGAVPDPREEVERRLAFRGERRVFLPEDPGLPAVEGVVAGLGENGELLLRTPDGSLRGLVSGSLR
jgi:BirA family biotin operon repressor/biotin-[acetyl-CoA-carboxylase] ligase